MKILTAAAMRDLDRATTEKCGVPSLSLMENAGTAVADFIQRMYPNLHRIGIVCGKGNNGGDGLVVARKLNEAGKDVKVLLLAEADALKNDAGVMHSMLPMAASCITQEKQLQSDAAQQVFKCELLIDAILGTGLKFAVEGLYAEAVRQLWVRWTEGATVVAVDIPSGADSDAYSAREDHHLRAPATSVVTFTAPKLRHVFDSALTRGPIVVAEIGTPPKLIESSVPVRVITARDLAGLLAPRAPDSHKGIFGHVLVVGGSVGKAGAAAMAGLAVLRSGAGLVTVAVPASMLPTVAAYAPELMTEGLPETSEGTISAKAAKKLDKLCEKVDVIAIGPGLSRNEESAEVARNIVKKMTEKPVVLDADGLNAFEGCSAELKSKRSAPLVLTPHLGEIARLGWEIRGTDHADRLKSAAEFSKAVNAILVLKGSRTLLTTPEAEIWVNASGNPGMATGGSGDVLTGIIAALLAQSWKTDPKNTLLPVIAAVHLHGVAGDIARERFGDRSMIATDMIAALPDAFRRLEERVRDKFIWIKG